MKETYSKLVKSELCHLNFSINEAKFFLKSFLLNNMSKKNISGQEIWSIKTHFSFIARFVISNLKKLYDVKDLKISFKKNNNSVSRRKYEISFIGNFQQIISDLDLYKFTTDFSANNLASAFLIGAFLSGGSINSPYNGNYHLEFQSFSYEYLVLVNEILKIFTNNKKNHILNRRAKYILYIKKSEVIADILKFMNLTETLFKFEDLRIERDFVNNMRRLNNLDISNLQKASKSSNEIIQMIKYIKTTNKYNNFSANLKLYCNIRLKHSELSLHDISLEMSKKLKKTFSKSNVWYLTNKIKQIYADLKKKNSI
ncbi:DNA-binding protein WhiA [Mycoplasmoides alvi]|uniref:DNA-binding protein WhiA n=1 Tax=Mycoplasmoides alvi TaxID=78580 RepID=UPI00051B56E8|nr:DNA-binding protein WhiA [Mycoplasmoides alvi]